MTSDDIGRMLDANPVVVRRTMAGLKVHGFVQSEKGHGGGWRLVTDLAQITLLDVYRALGEPPLFALGFANDRPACLVEQAVNEGLQDALHDAAAALLGSFANMRLADLEQNFAKRERANAHETGPVCE
jgi:DNA-binding IscR family transcriptional regulator